MELILVLMTLFVASVVSINNLPQTIIPLVKSEMVRKNMALALVALAASSGYLLQGDAVTYTVAHKLFVYKTEMFLAGVVIASLFLILSTISSISTSIQQLIILSLLGVYYSSGYWVNHKLLYVILLSWFGNMALTVFFVVLLNYALKHLINSISIYNRAAVMNMVALFSSLLLAYAMGSNTFGTISALLGTNLSEFHSKLAVVASIFYGTAMFNLFGELKRTKLRESFDVYHTTCAQLGCGASVVVFSAIGIPVSIIHALLAGLMTMAFMKRMHTIEKKAEQVLLRNLLFVPLLSFFVGLIVGFVFF